MENMIDYTKPHLCPVYGKELDPDLCYETLQCLANFFKISSVPELKEVRDIERAKILCKECIYSKLQLLSYVDYSCRLIYCIIIIRSRLTNFEFREVVEFMFEKMKEKARQRHEEREQKIREEKNRLLALSEKELLVEILMELKNVEDRLDDVERTIRLYND